MTGGTLCNRSWQAEALEDGRLSAHEAGAFQRHAATCEACGAAVRGLERLRELGRELPEPTRTALDRRRQLAELQRRAFEISVGAERRGARLLSGSAKGLVWAASCMALAATIVVLFWIWPGASGTPAAGIPSYRLQASPGAEWRVVERGATLRIAAVRGRVEVSVDPLSAGQRFIAELPDGELEVKGTRFAVTTDAERTLGVEVTEGRVALRVGGEPERLLGAGQSWAPSAAPAPPVAAAPREPVPEPVGSKPSAALAKARPIRAPVPKPEGVASTPPWRAKEDDAAAGAPPDPAPAPGAPPNAGADFVSAMAAFSSGDYARSDALFTAFAAAHPDDSRAEDALFLRAVARLRGGDAGGARAAARAYLERFPSGLRHEEAQRMVEPSQR